MIFTPTSKSNLSHILFQLSKSQENQPLSPLPTSKPLIDPNIEKPLIFLVKLSFINQSSHSALTYKSNITHKIQPISRNHKITYYIVEIYHIINQHKPTPKQNKNTKSISLRYKSGTLPFK